MCTKSIFVCAACPRLVAVSCIDPDASTETYMTSRILFLEPTSPERAGAGITIWKIPRLNSPPTLGSDSPEEEGCTRMFDTRLNEACIV